MNTRLMAGMIVVALVAAAAPGARAQQVFHNDEELEDLDTPLDGGGDPPQDTTPPSPVADLSADANGWYAVQLMWTAPGDGPDAVASYDVRYSTSPITAANFGSATPANGEPVPSGPGSFEMMAVEDLLPDVEYNFALKSTDQAGNASVISNIAWAATQALPAPAGGGEGSGPGNEPPFGPDSGAGSAEGGCGSRAVASSGSLWCAILAMVVLARTARKAA